MKFITALLLLAANAACAQAVNPAVTQDTTKETICARGWAASVRPSWAYTSRIKHRLCVARGMARCAPGLVLDHIIPLEAGGSPRDPKNLQLQTLSESLAKDAQEHLARREVCSGRITLSTAQGRFSRQGL